MKGIIDRFEGEFAVVELDNNTMIDIDICKIPKEAKEGDVIIIGENIKIDEEATKNLNKEIENLMKGMCE